MRLEVHQDTIAGHHRRIESLDVKVSEVLTKLAVPLFLVGIAGPVIGAMIVFALTKSLK